MTRLPVLLPVETPQFADYLIYYQDAEEGKLGPEIEREILHLVSERDARRVASSWQICSWVAGRVYGFRKIENEK